MKQPIRIELPMLQPKMSVNAYLFLEPEPVLIDCGMNTAETFELLKAELQKHGKSLADLAHVYITHAHIDHMGMAGRLAQETEAIIWVNPYTLPWTKDLAVQWQKRANIIESVLIKETPPDWENPMLSNMQSFFQQALACWSAVPSDKLKVYEVGEVLPFGGGEWEVLYVPGHSNTQTCFYERARKWLFSADMLLPLTPTPAIEMKVDAPDEREISIVRLLESFERMKRLEIEMVFPGHGEPFDNHRQLIDVQLSRIQLRKAECLTVIQKGKSSFFDIFQQIYPRAFNIFTLSMLKGYLDLLEIEESIQIDNTKGYRRYLAN
ncbi:MAG: MBL fold metallo-hydrolase [Saprospiraceae bacterium]|nr:MBL fold metallo-hydrolase [Saprospiraceae bacterium]